MFKKVLDSQKAFAERAVQWQNDYMVDFKMAVQPLLRQGRTEEGLKRPFLRSKGRPGAAGRLFLRARSNNMQKLLLAVDTTLHLARPSVFAWADRRASR